MAAAKNDQKSVLAALAAQNIAQTTTQHEAVLTVEAHQKVAGHLNGVLAKNLFVRDSKKKVDYLVVLKNDRVLAMKALAPFLGAKELRMSDKLTEVLGVAAGSATPLAVINNSDHAVVVILDKVLGANADKPVLVHPLINTATTAIKFDDLVSFVKKAGNPVHVVDFDGAVVAIAAAPATAAAAAAPAADAKKADKKGDDKKKDKSGDGHSDKKKAEPKQLTAAEQAAHDAKVKEGEEKKKAAQKKKADEAKKKAEEDAAQKKTATHSTGTAASTGGATAAAGDAKSESGSGLGILVKKSEDFATWYTQVVLRGEMIDYTDVSGCYVLRPWSYAIWEFIQSWFDQRIKALGVKNSYFPLFISQRALQTEKNHVEGFAPEVAWVTKSGETDLKEPIAVRPTSETVMYQLYSKWIRSHRDLPLKLNQWNNVVRWEFKKATPFIRSREFLWQEGHTAFATKPEADKEVLDILDLYRGVYEMLALPVVKGKKTELEKFAGGLYTTTVEAFIPAVGRAIQGATSHCLGQNFAKMFGIEFENEEGKRAMVWQNSWGLTTRTIGVMVMVHSDDKGLVLPPRVAPVQVVIIPIFFKENTKQALKDKAKDLANVLKASGIRVEVDSREHYTPGWKYNDWEMKGVPLRVELGPKDMDKQQVVVVNRKGGAKANVDWKSFDAQIHKMLDDFQSELYNSAKADMDAHTKSVTKWDDFMAALDGRNIALIPWCHEEKCEKDIKKRSGEWADAKEQERAAAAGKTADTSKEEVDASGEKVEKLTGAAKSLCIPFEQPALAAGTKCIGCGAVATTWCLFGRSY